MSCMIRCHLSWPERDDSLLFLMIYMDDSRFTSFYGLFMQRVFSGYIIQTYNMSIIVSDN